MAVKVINIEIGRPTVDEALRKLSQELRMAKVNRVKALKIIHGYGSSGKGGVIKKAVIKDLNSRKREGFIRHFVVGENFTPFYNDGRTAVSLCPELKKDRDYGRQNDGISIVIF